MVQIIPGPEAYGSLRKNRAFRWAAHQPPVQEGATRTRTKLLRPNLSPKFKISRTDSVFTMGSCFARNIEVYLESLGYVFPTRNPGFALDNSECSSPNGYFNKFTVPSMANELIFASGDGSLPDSAYVRDDAGRWQDGQSPATFASLERAKEIRSRVEGVTKAAFAANVMLLTLGLVEAWHDNENDVYWNLAPPANVIKAAPSRFSLRILSYEDNKRHLDVLYRSVARLNPNIKIVVTVSPVPLAATFSGNDIAVANMYSKSTLRAVASDFAAEHPNVDYFPSYEMAMDSDPLGVWTDDAVHVRDQMVECIITHFLINYLEDPKSLTMSGPTERLTAQIGGARARLSN
jgi:hypothetical protein